MGSGILLWIIGYHTLLWTKLASLGINFKMLNIFQSIAIYIILSYVPIVLPIAISAFGPISKAKEKSHNIALMKVGDSINTAWCQRKSWDFEQPVFITTEVCSTFPNHFSSTIPPIGNLTITEQGIQRIYHLTRQIIFKFCAQELTPIKSQFAQSVDFGELPVNKSKWKLANITPIFKLASQLQTSFKC